MQNSRTQFFYQCLTSLIDYGAEHLEEPLLCRPSITSNDARKQAAASRVLEYLWSNINLIMHYVQENPDHLTKRQLSTIALWRFALRDVFVCFETDMRHITCINDERIFSVGSLATPIPKLVGNMPALVILTLLPYQGSIVCDGRVIHISNNAKKPIDYIEQQFELASTQSLVATSGELIDYVRNLPEDRDVVPDFCNALMRTYYLEHRSFTDWLD